jgi:hypothetical protein
MQFRTNFVDIPQWTLLTALLFAFLIVLIRVCGGMVRDPDGTLRPTSAPLRRLIRTKETP